MSFLTGETLTNPAIDTSFDALVAPSSVSQKHSIAPSDDRQSKRYTLYKLATLADLDRPKADAEMYALSRRFSPFRFDTHRA